MAGVYCRCLVRLEVRYDIMGTTISRIASGNSAVLPGSSLAPHHSPRKIRKLRKVHPLRVRLPQTAPSQATGPQGTPTPATGTQAAPPQTSSSQDNAPGDSTPANVDSTAPGTKETSAKSGSEADVDAIGNRKVGHGPDWYSLEHEIALGKQLAQEVDRSAKFIDDPVVTEYVNRVAQNLVRNSDAECRLRLG